MPPSGQIVPASSAPRDFSVWLALALILVLAALLRYRLLPVPLERDEGEYAYAGQLILEGQPPYVDMYNMKMPGIYACYALILATFGQTHVAIHVALLLVNGTSIMLVFLIGRRLLGDWPALGAAAIFALFSLHSDVQGIFANAEHFVLVPVLGGLLLLLPGRISDLKSLISNVEESPDTKPSSLPHHQSAIINQRFPRFSWRIFTAGLLLGTGFIIKQHAAAFIAWGGLYLVLSDALASPRRIRRGIERALLFSAGALVPFTLTCLVFAAIAQHFHVDALGRFWFWTFTYANQYVRQMSLSAGWFNLSRFGPYHWNRATASLWSLGLLGLAALAWDARVRRAAPFLLGFLLFSIVAISPGLYFRPHYFVLTLPVVALWGGAALHGLSDALSRRRNCPRVLTQGAPVVLLGAALAYTVARSRPYLFWLTPEQIDRGIYELDPFPEALKVAQFIRAGPAPTDRVLILGSEPEILFYAHRRSATGYVYMYPLMELQPFAEAMQAQMISEVLASKPKMVVYVHVPHSWDMRPGSFPLVPHWMVEYRQREFRCVELVDIWSMSQPADYYTGDDLWIEPRAQYSWLKVYERREKPLEEK